MLILVVSSTIYSSLGDLDTVAGAGKERRVMPRELELMAKERESRVSFLVKSNF